MGIYVFFKHKMSVFRYQWVFLHIKCVFWDEVFFYNSYKNRFFCVFFFFIENCKNRTRFIYKIQKKKTSIYI
jgi:hypothetical protein